MLNYYQSGLSFCSPNEFSKSWETSELDPIVEIGEKVSKVGIKTTWSHLHKKGKDLQRLRFLSDDIVDQILDKHHFKVGDDVLEEVIKKSKEGDKLSQQFLDSVCQIPSWLDKEKLKRGQDFFKRNSFAIANSLLFFSLSSGFSSPNINHVLVSTGYLANKHTLRRVFETTQMILDCMESLELMNSEGWKSTIRVRFLHGKVRQRLRKFPKWNERDWGIPINQEDMIVTLLSFQANILFSLHSLGYKILQQEAEDYTHLWRYIGYLSGIQEEFNPCTSIENSEAMLFSVVSHVLQPDENSSKLVSNLMESLTQAHFIKYKINEIHFQATRELMGKELADAMGVPESNTFDRFLVHSIFYLFWILSCIAYIPFIGNYIKEIYFMQMKAVTHNQLQGRTKFSMSHAPKDENIGEDPLVLKQKHFLQSNTHNVLLFLVLLLLLFFFYFLLKSFLK